MSKNWAKGLTKESDPRVGKMSASLKGRKAWNKGLTKEVDPRLAYKPGRKHPATGKTYEEVYGKEQAAVIKKKQAVDMFGDKNPAKRPEVRAKIRKNHAARTDPNFGKKMAVRKTGKSRPDMLGDKNPAKRPEVRKKLSENNPMHSFENVMKQMQSASTFPNKAEQKLFDLVDQVAPEQFRLNMPNDDMVWIARRVPDIVSVRGKKLIEMFGDYWHGDGAVENTQSEKERLRHFKKYGWKCLIIWEIELKDLEKLKSKLRKFCGGKG